MQPVKRGLRTDRLSRAHPDRGESAETERAADEKLAATSALPRRERTEVGDPRCANRSCRSQRPNQGCRESYVTESARGPAVAGTPESPQTKEKNENELPEAA